MPSATSKRSRRAAFDDDEENNDGIAVVQATSSLRNESQRKKARISNAGPSKKSARASRQESVTSSDDDEEMQEPEEPAAPAATQYELMRDAGFRHLENTEIDDQRATQRLKNRPHILGENQVALNAIIESITCYNFMCHTRLHVPLGPLLNFIVGENGSGKSAILTAITLCLGGKASATNRGGSLRSFVKEGEDHASLVVQIKNQGPDAYKPELYGESITVERHFSKSGSSGFKLKASSGRIISTKKGDVDDIVEYYCLQVDNPLNVLSQDNARQFLNAATPVSKYKYFVQGTQLEQLDQDYQLLQETLEANETRLLAFQENITFLKEKSEKAIKLRDALTKSAEMRRQSKIYTNQLAWAQVMEQESILQQNENAILAAQEDINRMEVTIVEKTEYLETIDNKVREAEESLNTLKQEESEFKEQEEEAKTNFNDARASIEQTHTQERDIHQRLTNASQKVKDYEKKIREEERRLEEVNGGALAEKQKELEEAKRAIDNIRESQKSHAEQSSHIINELNEAQKKVQDSEELVSQKQQEVSTAESRLRTLSQNRSDPFAGFEPRVPQLLRLIDSDSGFSQKPIGPIGTLIQLTKPKWSAILEKVLGSVLSGFIVANRPDQVRLSSHMERQGIRNCPIFIGSRASLNNLREPDESFDTILRVLKFDDPRVRDQLVINQNIEQTILIEDREQAERVMFDGQQSENVVACLSFHDKKRGHGLRLTRRGRNIGTTPITPNLDQKSRMKSDDMESQIDFFKENLEQLRAEFRDLDMSRRTLQQAAQRCTQAVNQHKRQGASFEKELRNAQARVTHIEEELDKFEGADNKLQGYKNDLQEAQIQKDHYGNQFGELAMQKQEMNREAESLHEIFKKAKVAFQDHKAKISKAEDKVKRLEETRRLALGEKNRAHANIDMAKAAKGEMERSKEKQADVVADYIRQASAVAPERAYIPEGESVRSIERKFESIKEQLRKIRGQLGASDEEIQNRASQAIQEYREAKKSHKNLTSLVDELKKALMDRLRKWRTFQRLISAHARCNFNYLLSERGFRGELFLDHKAKRLQVQVEPDETRKTSSGRNTKTLSGGEKSFSSICLLLAIWDAMGSPLRCLDEFDVFMDNVNRAISTNMLITTARRSVGKQFILITPNAIEGRAKIDKDVKIIRLTDPRQRLITDH
ncbi:P-loop containing nucleoside triphosphate hydrolase protein [Annulohypoxylon truncatum]|uniref:P-loop containing nucleoside triphosphate hydrolase protein n=1 Tax=Annulohypoxylon truncatum TaxID=327061 RepID=UPI0020074ED4|nr:P-loop containing nucleoside triphosphate hydrolase protein [Annulohypoxylon truncatum]KAI1204161.1 P-loop containing nucleoside triphosphate hydrolase protein [Annulohypoxylon truncatum]